MNKQKDFNQITASLVSQYLALGDLLAKTPDNSYSKDLSNHIKDSRDSLQKAVNASKLIMTGGASHV